MKVKYTINGKVVTKEEFDSLPKKPIGAPMVRYATPGAGSLTHRSFQFRVTEEKSCLTCT